MSLDASANPGRGGGKLTEIAVIGLSVLVLFAALIWLAGHATFSR